MRFKTDWIDDDGDGDDIGNTSLDGDSWTPCCLESVKTYCSSGRTDVGVPDLRVEFHFWGHEWILIWELNVNTEPPAFIWSPTL